MLYLIFSMKPLDPGEGTGHYLSLGEGGERILAGIA